MINIDVAHSPDADDIFMFYAIKFGWVSLDGVSFNNYPLDIETLNKEAIKLTYDVSAISFALYPHIKDDYALLKTAASFGEGYGPKLIKPIGKTLKKDFKVALSGEFTTNAMLFKIAYPDAQVVYKNFLDIEKAVLSKEVDAGVLIHESILDFDESLEVEAELFDIWIDLAKKMGDKIQLVGDDVFVTNSSILYKGIKENVANAILIKPNQIGTISETIQAIRLAQRANYRCVMSHRSGESEDTFIADLSVGINCREIKTGATARSERVAKYNRLLKIESELNYPTYLGRSIFKL